MSKNTLLGKKRESRETEEDELGEMYKTRQEKETAKNGDHLKGDESAKDAKEDKDKSPEKKEEKPKTLFGEFMASDKTLTGGLFGNIGGEEKKTDFKLGLGGSGSSGLFTGSLFNSNSNSNSLFNSKPLFNFSSLNNSSTSFFSNLKNSEKKDEDSDEEGEGDDVFQQSNSPNPYNPTEKIDLHSKDKSPYTKKYVKEVENIFVYVKDEGKFISKGKGYLSIEYAEVEGKKIGVVVFRNTLGNKMIEGFLSSNLKLTKYVKNFKHIASFSYLNKSKTGKFEIGYCKVPYAREEELKEFEKTFNEVTSLLTPSTEQKTEKAEEEKTDKNADDKKTVEKK